MNRKAQQVYEQVKAGIADDKWMRVQQHLDEEAVRSVLHDNFPGENTPIDSYIDPCLIDDIKRQIENNELEAVNRLLRILILIHQEVWPGLTYPEANATHGVQLTDYDKAAIRAARRNGLPITEQIFLDTLNAEKLPKPFRRL